MLAGDEILERSLGCIVARTALGNLINRGDRARVVRQTMDLVRIGVAIRALGFTVVDTAAYLPFGLPMAVAAGLVLVERFEIGTFMGRRYIDMAVGALGIRMHGTGYRDVFVTSQAVLLLCLNQHCKQQNKKSESDGSISIGADGHVVDLCSTSA